jgi:PD-(D/E)XK endonuclease
LDFRDHEPTLSDHPVDVGHRTEGAILSGLVRRGYAVLLPFGVNQRYDLVVDLGGRFIRAQCKTGRLADGVVRFSARSVRSNTRGTYSRGYIGDADIFLVHCPETDRIYAVPVENAPANYMHLRMDPTVNGQARGVHWATDYELPG